MDILNGKKINKGIKLSSAPSDYKSAEANGHKIM